jgi:hypothetical protein
MLREFSIVGLLLCLGAAPTLAEGTHLPPITDKTVLKECSTCHMAFPPQFLPARSWQAIMAGLGSHFGEDASVAAQDNTTIVAYLTAHAADAPKTPGSARYMKGVAKTSTPLQITKMPFWLRWHNEISAARFASPQVKTAANCEACHKGAAKGVFAEVEQEE